MHLIRMGRFYCHERLIEPLTFVVCILVLFKASQVMWVLLYFRRVQLQSSSSSSQCQSSLRACLPSHFEGWNWPAQTCCVLFKRQKCSCHCLCAPVTEIHFSVSRTSNMLIYLQAVAPKTPVLVSDTDCVHFTAGIFLALWEASLHHSGCSCALFAG